MSLASQVNAQSRRQVQKTVEIRKRNDRLLASLRVAGLCSVLKFAGVEIFQPIIFQTCSKYRTIVVLMIC